MITVENVAGKTRLVQTVEYSDGKVVRRTLDPQTGMPDSVEVVKASRPIVTAIRQLKSRNKQIQLGYV